MNVLIDNEVMGGILQVCWFRREERGEAGVFIWEDSKLGGRSKKRIKKPC